MKLVTNQIYKVNINLDPLESNEYEYFICSGEKDDYYILIDYNIYRQQNGFDYNPDDDFDEILENTPEIDIEHYKYINSLESVYYKNKVIKHELVNNKRKFKIV